jgi:class 3 adenylate cyclase
MLNAVARPIDALASPAFQALGGMLVTDWEMFSENAGSLSFGWGQDKAHVFAEYVRACTTQRTLTRMYAALASIDVTDVLPTIGAPTLVLHHTGVKFMPLDLAKQLVSRIPNCRLVVIEGLFTPTSDEEFAPVREFLLGEAAPAPHDHAGASTLRTVLFTDLVGHTEMMSRLGDERGRAVLREHEDITRNVLKAHGGTEVKTMGDGFMASFGSVTKAVECAVALQRAIDQRNRGESGDRGVGAEQLPEDVPNSDEAGAVAQPLRASDPGHPSREPFTIHSSPFTIPEPLHVRVGLNAGEPIEEDGDLFGATVILASRIAAKADAGEILVADTVRGLCSGKGFLFADRGEFVARGFEDPVRVYEVSWRG